MPAVTVLMAVWNGESHLAASIRSVLAQTFQDFELLIIDDASTDSTPEILRSFSDERIRTIRLPNNIGLTPCLNRGLELARGELIARQDADDLWQSNRLALQTAFLAKRPEVAIVGSQAMLIDERGRRLGVKNFPLTHRAIEWMSLFDNPLAHSAVMFRRTTIQQAGAYDESYPASQDYELWARMSPRTQLANLPERLVTLSIRDDSITRTHRKPELIQRIQREQNARLFPDLPLREEDLEILAQFRSTVHPENLDRFHQLFRERLARFQATHPETIESRDFWRTVAMQLARVGYNLLSVSPRAAWKEIRRAMQISPASAFELPWARILALTFCGDSARRLYRKLAPENTAR